MGTTIERPATGTTTGNGFDMRHKSRHILDGNERAGARAMLKGTGFTDDDLKRPIVGVAHCWIETMPCNINQRASPSSSRTGSGLPAAPPRS
jgi:dihydroxy-acid dehydratase